MKKLLITLMLILPLTYTAQSYEEVKEYIYGCDSIKSKDIVLKQSILETGWYKSYTCRKRHNLFGFRYKTWVTEKNPQGYIIFDTWEESIEYYKRWQGRHYKGGDYYDFLVKRGYAESPTYVQKLKKITLR
jgi:flagellum-specific peptidoglycan hydrolase FlgJ